MKSTIRFFRRVPFPVIRLVGLFLLVLALVSPGFSAGPVPAENPKLQGVFDSFPVQDPGNQTLIRLLNGNEEAWYARWSLLESARKSIVSTYFIVDDDIFGWSFLGLLQKKAREGLSIRLMIDGRFARSAKKWKDFDELQELAAFPNVQIRLYNPISKALPGAVLDLRNVLLSNHDKIIIVDGETCLTGGRNIGKDYFVQYGEHTNVFEDMDVVMRGSGVVKQLQMAFDEEWGFLKNSVIKKDLINFTDQTNKLDIAYRVMNRYLQGSGLSDPEKLDISDNLKNYLRTYNAEISRYKKLSSFADFRMFRGERPRAVRILDKNSMKGPRDDIGPNLIRLIDSARDEILMQNAYIVLSSEAEEALVRAAKRGVKVIFLTNSADSTNHQSTTAFFMNDWQRLLAKMPGSHIYVFPAGKPCIHTKAFVFDSQLAIVGTYNLDPLSMVVNSEVVTVVWGHEFAIRTAGIMRRGIQDSLEYKVSVDERGNITRVFGPEDHLQKEMVEKLNRLRKLQWIRPLI